MGAYLSKNIAKEDKHDESDLVKSNKYFIKHAYKH